MEYIGFALMETSNVAKCNILSSQDCSIVNSSILSQLVINISVVRRQTVIKSVPHLDKISLISFLKFDKRQAIKRMPME